jgi:hypothetical protein
MERSPNRRSWSTLAFDLLYESSETANKVIMRFGGHCGWAKQTKVLTPALRELSNLLMRLRQCVVYRVVKLGHVTIALLADQASTLRFVCTLLFVKNDIQQRAMNLQAAVVADEA